MSESNAETRPSILVVGGSPRSFGRTRAISRFAVERLTRLGMTVNHVELSELGLPLYDGTSEQNGLPSVKEWKTAAATADGFFFATPDYHNGMSGALKNALDFLGEDHFRRKPAAIAAMAGGGKGGMNALNNLRIVLRGLYALVIAEQAVVDKDQIDSERNVTHPQAIRRLESVVDELAYMTRLIQSGRH